MTEEKQVYALLFEQFERPHFVLVIAVGHSVGILHSFQHVLKTCTS
jgi:hypothetical protein